MNGLSDIGEGEGYLNNMKHLSKVKIEFEGECVNPPTLSSSHSDHRLS